MDDEHVVAILKTIDRTNLNAVGIFALDTVFSNDICHYVTIPIEGRMGLFSRIFEPLQNRVAQHRGVVSLKV